MRDYPIHGKTDCLFHSVYVSFCCFRAFRNSKLDIKSLVTGSLLHDFFLYNWYTTKHDEFHAYYHPKKSLENAKRFFEINPLEEEIIRKHMWPMTISLPRHKETYVVTFFDKYCAIADIVKTSGKFVPVYERILKEAGVYGE
jgi:uncharacterized protein